MRFLGRAYLFTIRKKNQSSIKDFYLSKEQQQSLRLHNLSIPILHTLTYFAAKERYTHYIAEPLNTKLELNLLVEAFAMY
jgi:hypothetical protein